MSDSPFLRTLDARTRRVCYSADEDRWLIVWPCDRCGGVELPLIARLDGADPAESVPELDDAPASCACPGCHAGGKRRALSHGPEVWWDPQASGWVVRVPCGLNGSAILPLGIPWYDAPRALVETAAADLVYLGELDDVWSRD